MDSSTVSAMVIFRRIRAAGKDIARLEQQKQQRWDALTNIAGPLMDPNGGGRGTSDPDKNGRIQADIDLLERRIRARRERLEAETVSALALLDMLPDLESMVMHRYYLQGKTTTEIAREKSYTEGYVRKTKRQAEMALGMLSPEQVAGTLPGWYLRDFDGKEGVT